MQFGEGIHAIIGIMYLPTYGEGILTIIGIMYLPMVKAFILS